LTTLSAYRLITPRRRWWAWGLAFAAGWAVLAALQQFDAHTLGQVLVGWAPVLMLCSPVILSVVVAVFLLKADRDSRRLEPLALTKADYLPLLRAYHWRACMSGALLVAILIPYWIAGIQAFSVRELFFTFGAAVLLGLSGLYWCAALGLALLVWMRSRAAAIILALFVGCQVQLDGGLYGGFAASWISEWLWPSARSSMLWLCLSITGSTLLPVFLAEVALRLAARRLGRLMAD
jgi:hypothetical protein